MRLSDLRQLDAYLASLRIETVGEPKPFLEVADPWQLADIRNIAPALAKLVDPTAAEPPARRAMWIRPRGCSKTADAAMLVAWVLAFSRRRRRCVWIAADKDQGCEGLDGVATLCRHNDWLNDLLTIRTDKAENLRTGSVSFFTTSDVASSYGWKDIDLLVLDELVHWRANGEQLWTSVFSTAGKRETAVVLVLSNAGHGGTWQQALRDKAAADNDWLFSELPGMCASWIGAKALEDQQKFLPPAAYARLWQNQWVAAGGDALSPELIDGAFDPHLRPQSRALSGYTHVAGVDAGISRDASAVCILGVRRGRDGHGHIRLVATKVWRPSKGKRVDLAEVEEYLSGAHQQFKLRQVNYDPWELRYLASRLQSGGLGRITRAGGRASLPLVEVPPTGANLQRVASAVLEAFNDGRVQLYEDADLRRDLTRMRVEERSYGFRLVSPRDASGHGDLGTAFCLAMLAASELAAVPQLRVRPLFAPESDDAPAPITPWSVAAAQVEYNARLEQAEQEQLAAGGSGNEDDFRLFMMQRAPARYFPS